MSAKGKDGRVLPMVMQSVSLLVTAMIGLYAVYVMYDSLATYGQDGWGLAVGGLVMAIICWTGFGYTVHQMRKTLRPQGEVPSDRK